MISNLWNKDEKIIKMLIKHYNLELKASNFYTHIGTIYKSMDFENVGKFYLELANDKVTSHLPRILDYFLNLDLEMPIGSESIPEAVTNKDVKHLTDLALKMELELRKHVGEICEYALNIKDYETFEMIQWFVKDAIKDLADINDIATFINAPNANLLTIENAAYRKNKHKD